MHRSRESGDSLEDHFQNSPVNHRPLIFLVDFPLAEVVAGRRIPEGLGLEGLADVVPVVSSARTLENGTRFILKLFSAQTLESTVTARLSHQLIYFGE